MKMYQGRTDMLKLQERISVSLLHFVVCVQVVILNAVLHVQPSLPYPGSYV